MTAMLTSPIQPSQDRGQECKVRSPGRNKELIVGLGEMVPICGFSTQETEAGRSKVSQGLGSNPGCSVSKAFTVQE